MAILNIPLLFGRLTVRHKRRLRSAEIYGKVRVWRLGPYRVAWWPRRLTAKRSEEPGGDPDE
ncbi:hypothetical protein [Prosthecomicrobium pneumaticum]|uniref:Uncharacterized protein n=1 Tax=Prosthecomicrobium pneumaticum TaxID=81895 RepID=A0A7W9FPQ0_9HYPH|nr:hypothetical protein [Prosthecomicrobium pneumaticum]MBB5754517.1 hypothetical protein [Prosthecomicrobium pneumaticum]